ncbi:MAG: pirin family protein [Alphaproteobacteria bacterium]|nr:MAG: pirin family protein [Alphaproteobacteria bacterium]
MTNGAIDFTIEGKVKDLGGFRVRRLLPVAKRRSVGPFVFLDHMGPATLAPGKGIDVRPHPHIGLATVTYLYEGSLMHRDSLGSVQLITPGDVNLMTAGRGIAHSERSAEDTREEAEPIHGLQLWVALPTEKEEMAPEFLHVPKKDLPEIGGPGWTGRLVAGFLFGATSPVVTQSPLFFADLRLEAGAELSFSPQYDEAAVQVTAGEIEIDGETVSEGSLAILNPGAFAVFTARTDAMVAVLGGEKLPEKHFMFWNFVSSREERIEQAKEDWRQQRFDKIPGETEFIPLPE